MLALRAPMRTLVLALALSIGCAWSHAEEAGGFGYRGPECDDLVGTPLGQGTPPREQILILVCSDSLGYIHPDYERAHVTYDERHGDALRAAIMVVTCLRSPECYGFTGHDFAT